MSKSKVKTEWDPERIIEVDEPWYVISTIAGQELEVADVIRYKVSRNLYSRCWIPTKTERRKYKGKLIDKRLHLIAGYVFLSTSHPDKVFLELRMKDTYLRFLRTDTYFHKVQSNEVDLIRKLTGWNKMYPDNVDVSIGVIENNELHVVEGPLVGLEKYVIDIDRHKMRAILSIYLLGAQRRLNFALCIIERAD